MLIKINEKGVEGVTRDSYHNLRRPEVGRINLASRSVRRLGKSDRECLHKKEFIQTKPECA
jgi:hypothetical protein